MASPSLLARPLDVAIEKMPVLSKEIFICYWIGEETYGTLDTIPAYVDIAPLAFVGITKDYQLEFGGFATPIPVVQGWVKTVQANKTKVLFSINSQTLADITDAALDTFVANVVATVDAWAVDGLDFDYEPPDFEGDKRANLTGLVAAFRKALKPGAILSMPIYGAWLTQDGISVLQALVPYIDYFSTMDYTGYPGYGTTIENCKSYADAVTWQNLVIGVSCMGPPERSWITPLDDVVKLARYEPGQDDADNTESKAGFMLYTFNYDRRWRTSETNPGTGTGYSNLAWTETIHANLP